MGNDNPSVKETDSPSPPGQSIDGGGGIFGTVDRGATLTDKVYDRLRQGILRGVWEPGQKITARGLSRELGVSLTPVREAMMHLANEGALHVSETRTFIIPLLKREQYWEIVQIRLALEPIATEAATPHLTDEFIDRLSAINESMLAMIRQERFNEALQRDSEFHLLIYDQAGLPTLRSIIDTVWLRAGPTRNRLSYSFRKRLVGYKNHQRILSALRERNPTAAAEAVARDLSEGAQAILEVLTD